MAGRSWSVPVYGRFELKDLATGTVINRSKIKILDLPRLTNRGSYIVGGSEYMFPLQKRLRSGAYTRTGQDGELRTFFNLAKGANFHLGMHPEKGYFQFQIGSSSNIRLYPLLVALGVSDQKMVNAWGREAWKSNHLSDTRAHAKELKRIAKAMSYGEDAEEDVVKQVKTLFADTEMDGENAALTLGKKFSSVSGDAMLAASKKILDVARGDSKEDNRDSLIHNDITDLRGVEVQRRQEGQSQGHHHPRHVSAADGQHHDRGRREQVAQSGQSARDGRRLHAGHRARRGRSAVRPRPHQEYARAGSQPPGFP
jgi:DNA-directed RNA polymerase beta subunit